ncbi:MAG: DNA ligase-associated DEXH box helicase [Phycisphaerae bacterium]|nr:MAG: DNA ligase-associated DEXH box helicase [Phycisphaerae bacterium]
MGRDLLEQWFASRGWSPWPFQRNAWDAHAQGHGGLIEVPTGAGKTYAAFGAALIDLIDHHRALGPAWRGRDSGLHVLYLTPLRAVARDIELALRAPIDDLALPYAVEGRTGDTPAAVRLRQKTRPPHVLVTTPESLSLLLTRDDAAMFFASLRSVIVDEWHDLLPSKRGSQVELALARLRTFATTLRTWALSATLPNLDEALAASAGVDDAGRPRPGVLIRGGMRRETIIDSILPSSPHHLPWAGHLGLTMLPEVLAALDPRSPTIVFTNTRSQAERWFHAIVYHRPQWTDAMALHHGSLDRDERERVEAGLKSGSLRLVVATSSLDLGVDFAPVERVVQIGSPKGIARIAQRAGRAAHRPMTPCRISCVPTHALELIEIDAARSALIRGDLEPRTGQPRPLDVLAQHLVTCALGGGFDADVLFREVRTAHAYRDLTRGEFEWALDAVHTGGALHAYPNFRRVARLPDGRYAVTDRRIAQLHRLNVGTIVSDSSVELRYVRGRSLGRIEESFVANLREGQRFVFAGKTLTFAYIRDAVAFARPAKGRASITPIWSGTRLPISESLAAAIREALASPDADSPERAAAAELLAAQRRLSHVPRPDETLTEVHHTREGTHLFLFPFEGRLVHAGLAALFALRLTRLHTATLTTAVDDYGLEILAPREFPFVTLLTPALFSSEGLLDDVAASLRMSQLAKLQFREVARVAGLVQENAPGAKKPVRHTRASSSLLFDVLAEFDAGNMFLHQARREVLERHFEHSRLARTLRRLEQSTLRLTTPPRLTPLAFPLLLERQSATLSSQSLAQRLAEMRREWTP